MNSVSEELLLEFIHQKAQLARSAGVKHTPVPTWSRAVLLWGKHMDAVAAVVQDWGIAPAIIMQAAFDQAKRNRHPDGPQVNMLKSDKFLTNALSMHLNLPVAAIRERRSHSLLMEIMDKEFSDVIFPPDLMGFTIEDACFRYAEARRRGEDITAVMLASDVLARVTADRRMDAWLTHRGYPFMDIAHHYNSVSNDMMTLPPLTTDQNEL